jgi:molybdenum cofactor biosynthesis enzyme
MKTRGNAAMADVSGKPETAREVLAERFVHLSAAAWTRVR